MPGLFDPEPEGAEAVAVALAFALYPAVILAAAFLAGLVLG